MLYSNLTLDGIPNGNYELIWYNNINRYKNQSQDYFISFVIRNLDTKNLEIIYRNIKEIPAIPLGSIIENKRFTGKVIGEEYTRVINIPEHNEYTRIKQQGISVYTSEIYFNYQEQHTISTNNKTYKLLDRSQEQTLLEYKDIDGNIILFPSYVIAQYFYCRTASMIKQLMASNLKYSDAIKGLYKDTTIDEEGNATITLLPGAKGTDGAEIFRFAKQQYANNMFHRVYQDLAASSQKIKTALKKKNFTPQYNTAVLSAFFPFYGSTHIRFRGKILSDNRILVLEIIAEDSNYPFESLTIYREHKKFNDKLVQIGKVQNKFKAKVTEFMSNKNPNHSYEDVEVKSKPREDGRIGLRDKEIDYKSLDVDEEAESYKTAEKVDQSVDISSNEAEYSGNLETAQANTETGATEEPDDWHTTERPGLEDFLLMLQEAQIINDDFEYTVNDQLMCPQKPSNDRSRKKWLKALMSDNQTPRAYSYTNVELNNRYACVIDVERDSRVEGLSVLIIAMHDNTPISDSLIEKIMTDFVRESGTWLKKITPNSFNYKKIKHPANITEESIRKWATRLLNVLNDI